MSFCFSTGRWKRQWVAVAKQSKAKQQTTVKSKDAISVFPVLQGSAETLIRWGGKLHHSVAYFCRNLLKSVTAHGRVTTKCRESFCHDIQYIQYKNVKIEYSTVFEHSQHWAVNDTTKPVMLKASKSEKKSERQWKEVKTSNSGAAEGIRYEMRDVA